MKRYIVVKNFVTYDDEQFSVSNSYNITGKLFNSKEEAKEEAKQKTLNFIRSADSYEKIGNSWQEVTGCQHFMLGTYLDYDDYIEIQEELALDYHGIENVREPNIFPPDATDELILKCLELASLTFFDVIEVQS